MSNLRRIFLRSGRATRWDLLKACLYTATLSFGTSLLYVQPSLRVALAALIFTLLVIVIIVVPVYNAMERP